MGALAVPSIGYAFKKLGNAITAGRVAKLDELLRERSPLAYQTKLSLGGYAQAAQNFQAAGGDMATGVRLLAASRDLANALNEAGIEADPEKLMRAATAPDTQQELAASRAPGVSIQAATPETIRAQAADAIARGAPREAVIKRLQDAGYDATGL